MGIVFKQSFKNSLIIYLAFLIGGINTIIFYPRLLGADFYGLVTFLLSASNLFMPLIAFGVHFTIIKFFSSYQEKEDKDRFLSAILFLPLFIALPMGFLWDRVHDWVIQRLSEDNTGLMQDYTLTIYIVALACAYFEVFYAWAKVQLQSVFGNVLKEFWNRAVIMLLLITIFLGWITKPEFIYFLTGTYILRTIIMMIYAFKLYFPKFSFVLPENYGEVIRYSCYIILAGSASAIILDIDKVMIPGKDTIETAAYYSVAVFIGTFIEAPSRAMRQILQPLTSKTLNENDHDEVNSLYKRSSINLLLIGGLFFLLVNCNVHELFKLMPDKGYAGGEIVVLLISLVKLYHMFLGNNNDIITNSRFYRIVLPFSVGTALMVYFLNKLFYFELGFGTDGLALATFITIYLLNSIKLWFVQAKFKMNPFTNKTLFLLLIIAVVFFIFYYWNFTFHPLINMVIKSALISVAYLLVVIGFKISPDINKLLDRLRSRFL